MKTWSGEPTNPRTRMPRAKQRTVDPTTHNLPARAIAFAAKGGIMIVVRTCKVKTSPY